MLTVSQLRRHLPLLTQFLTGQLALQFLNIVNGFFLLRWLTIDQQAQFSFAFSIQMFLSSLSDFGFSGSIIALTGGNYLNKGIVGRYVNTATTLRNKFFYLSCIVCLAAYPLLIRKQHWDPKLFAVNLLPVLLAVYSQANAAIYAVPLILEKKMNQLFVPQVCSSAARLMANYALYLSALISAGSTLLVNALLLLFNAKAIKRVSCRYFQHEISATQESKKEMFSYLKPMIPSLLFNSIYGQVQIFLITYFGKSANIAEVAALGRLSQVFVLLAAFNEMIVAPIIAKSTFVRLWKNYVSMVCVAIAIAVSLLFSALLWPHLYMLLLGEKFYHLEDQLIYLLMNASLAYVGGVLWTMHSARKWIFWWGTWTYIVGITLCQAAGIILLDLSTTHGVLLLGLSTNLFVMLTHILTGLVGFANEYRARDSGSQREPSASHVQVFVCKSQ